jgi:DNA (cytosine-5)-methyltransferase 1
MVKLGSLCSGYGGLDLAAEQVFGAETVWHAEIDEAASKVLAERWPGVPNHGDLTAVDWSTVEPVDVVCAGWPCQPWSLAGKKKGADDERAIWPEIARAVRELRPRYVFLENVSAVVVLGELARAAGDLAQIGYDTQWTCLSASEVGAPHKRERFFILATDVSGVRRHEGRAESAGVEGGSDASFCGTTDLELLPTPRTTDANGPGAHGGGGLDLRTTVCELLPTPTVTQGRNATSGRSDPDSQHHTGTTLNDVAYTNQWGKYRPVIRRWELALNGTPAPAPTEPNAKGNPRLSARFAEWMMGLPAGWVTDVDLPRSAHLKILGNGVVPHQAVAALSWLLNVSEVAA